MTGIFTPCEWAGQDAVWLTWPSMPQWWKGRSAEEIASAFASLAAAVSKFETVRINCAPSMKENAERALKAAGADLNNVEFFPNLSDDVWCRDSGAVFRLNNGELEAVDFKYNAWGGKFPPWDRDDKLASEMARSINVKSVRFEEMVCEGGALEFGPKGELMTTDCVVLNPARNQEMSRETADEIFKKALGVKEVVWLPDGLFNDDTDGHIDNIARFTPCGKILAASCTTDNPSYESLKTNRDILTEGARFDVVDLPVPDAFVRHSQSGKILPASYANYLVINGAVIVPSYAQKYSDDRSKALIADFFPGREIVGLDCRLFLEEGGAVHCLTQQQPAIPEKA